MDLSEDIYLLGLAPSQGTHVEDNYLLGQISEDIHLLGQALSQGTSVEQNHCKAKFLRIFTLLGQALSQRLQWRIIIICWAPFHASGP